jgi:hypothetical protein
LYFLNFMRVFFGILLSERKSLIFMKIYTIINGMFAGIMFSPKIEYVDHE